MLGDASLEGLLDPRDQGKVEAEHVARAGVYNGRFEVGDGSDSPAFPASRNLKVAELTSGPWVTLIWSMTGSASPWAGN